MFKNNAIIAGIICDTIKIKQDNDNNNIINASSNNNVKGHDLNKMAVVDIHNSHNMPASATYVSTNISSKNCMIKNSSSLKCCDSSQVWKDYKKLKTYLLFKDRDKVILSSDVLKNSII